MARVDWAIRTIEPGGLIPFPSLLQASECGQHPQFVEHPGPLTRAHDWTNRADRISSREREAVQPPSPDPTNDACSCRAEESTQTPAPPSKSRQKPSRRDLTCKANHGNRIVSFTEESKPLKMASPRKRAGGGLRLHSPTTTGYRHKTPTDARGFNGNLAAIAI